MPRPKNIFEEMQVSESFVSIKDFWREVFSLPEPRRSTYPASFSQVIWSRFNYDGSVCKSFDEVAKELGYSSGQTARHALYTALRAVWLNLYMAKKGVDKSR